MELVPLKPRRGEGTFRIDDSDDFVVIESLGQFPSNGLFPESGVYIENHGVIVVCTEGMAQFEHDGQTIQLRKNDMFIYVMKRSVITNLMSSQNFNCRSCHPRTSTAGRYGLLPVKPGTWICMARRTWPTT